MPPLEHATQQTSIAPQMFTTAAQLLDLTDSKGLHISLLGSWSLGLEILRGSRTFDTVGYSSQPHGDELQDRPVKMRIIADTSARVEKLMVSLRDGRKLIGVLRSWDQFGMLAHIALTASHRASNHTKPISSKPSLTIHD